jgi:hypothetical protein
MVRCGKLRGDAWDDTAISDASNTIGLISAWSMIPVYLGGGCDRD